MSRAAFKGEFFEAAAYSPDGKLLAIGRAGETEKGKIVLLDPASGKKVHELTGHLGGTNDLVFTADGKHLLSSGRDTLVRIWSVSDGKQVAELGKSRGGQFKDVLHSVALSPDQLWVAAADMAGMVHVWRCEGK
jgi:WD40 repeat protein